MTSKNETKKKYPLIEALTPEQQAALPVYKDKWIAIAMSTGRMTTDEKIDVARAVKQIYATSKFAEPKVLIVASPYAAVIGGSVMAYLVEKKGRTAEQAFEAISTNGEMDREKIRALKDEAASYVSDWTSRYHGGNTWAGACAMMDFWDSIIGTREDCVEAFQKWYAWRDLAKMSGFRYLHKDFCLVSEKPTVLKTFLNDRGVYTAHCEDGPSHAWGDGFEIFFWRGVRVPRQVIKEPETITVEHIQKETNAEVRRILRERFGEGKYLAATGAKVIDSDFESARKGAAPRALLEDSEGVRWLVGCDGSTKRTYYMRVREGINTCKDAHESLCGFKESRIINKS